ncbi:MAG: hypothetical protein ED557_01495 [Balneola sp.]|nr:MAG: hypothetical protein ED557_01495 [Balneola sp.]
MKKYVGLVLVLLLVLGGNRVEARQPVADSLIQWLQTDNSIDTSRVDNLNEIVRQIYRGYPDSARSYAFQALRLAEQLGYLKGEANAYRRLGSTYFSQDKNDSSMFYFEKSLELYEELNDPVGIAIINASIGTIYAVTDNYEPAIESFLEALDSFEKFGNTQSMGIMYNNVGNLFLEQELYSNAMEHYQNALEVLSNPQSEPVLSMVYSNLAITQYEMGELGKSRTSVDLGIENALEYRRLVYLPGLYTTSGRIKKDTEDFDGALEDFNQGLIYSRDIGNQAKEAEILYYIAIIEDKLGRPEEAKEQLTIVLKTIGEDEDKDSELELEAFDFMAQLEFKLGNYREAYLNSEKAGVLSDSMYSEEMAVRISEIETIYETEKKEAQIRILEAENELANLRSIVIGVVGFVLIISVSLLTLLYFRRKAQKKRLQMDSLKTELKHYGVLITEKNRFISEVQSDLERIKRHVSTSQGRKEFSDLIFSMHSNMKLTDDEPILFSKIEQANAGFFAKLENLERGLTANDIRIASLVEMDLGNKEIATILSIDPRSVIQAKYRLKKKLDISQDTELKEYLSSMV